MPVEALKVMRCKLQALIQHNEMVPCLISSILLSYPQQTEFQQLFLYALCRGYFKNPSGKYKIISGEKCVISLHEDSAGVESAMR